MSKKITSFSLFDMLDELKENNESKSKIVVKTFNQKILKLKMKFMLNMQVKNI